MLNAEKKRSITVCIVAPYIFATVHGRLRDEYQCTLKEKQEKRIRNRQKLVWSKECSKHYLMANHNHPILYRLPIVLGKRVR